MSHQDRASFDWVLWLQWVLASTLGWLLGLALVGDIGIGTAMGLTQWLILRSQVHQAGQWILASTGGWIVGLMAVTALPPEASILIGAVLGVTLGTAQWFILRRWVYQAGWWIATSILGWAVGPMFGAVLVGGIVGAVTGIALDLQLRYARPET